jgi:hypothetical protein
MAARLRGRLLALVAMACVAVLAGPRQPRAAYARVVLCVNPSGTNGCFATVRDAVDAAPRSARIDVAPGTYLGAFLVGRGSNVSIRGSGAAQTILDGERGLGVVVVEGGVLTLNGVTVRNAETGVRVSAAGRLKLAGVVLRDHQGTAIRLTESARLDARRIRIFDNTDGMSFDDSWIRIARGRIASHRFGIFGFDSRLELIDSVVRNNGSGVEHFGGATIVRRSRILDNENYGLVVAGDRGSGLVVESTLARNGRGVASTSLWANNARLLRVERSTISGGIGPGISSSAQRTEIVASTISGNTTGVNIESTFAKEPPLSMSGTTIVGNLLGIRCFGPNCGSLVGTIVANSEGSDCIGTFASRGSNLIENPDGCDLAPGSLSDVLNVDPAVGPLVDNGGPTKTHALLPGSPAIGAVNGGRLCRQPDQRGERRPRPCAIGAYEPSSG